MIDPLSGQFGKESVDADERERRIRSLFQAVAGRYDLMNDIMSMGVHRLWKRGLARAVNAQRGERVVDLAGGTGDVARLMAKSGARVVVCDPSPGMMAVGRGRCPVSVDFVEGSAESMPFDSHSVDALTISFGLRNVTSLHTALAEIHRVLRPGGRFLCLEFSRPWPLIAPFYDAWSYTVIPRLGAWVAGEPAAYGYLIDSIRNFPAQAELASAMRDAGFTDVGWRNYSGGIACLHRGTKA
ncbi:MAG: class I SAM-dependent methyltransferase [Magnetospirillum gryphiswaldense]|nr:class I SAM-dependent methyltransferase [Magnetospirillum gryphiswaldense]